MYVTLKERKKQKKEYIDIRGGEGGGGGKKKISVRPDWSESDSRRV